jgi:predicted  nucleic acid-binding Zn-ribbon protein
MHPDFQKIYRQFMHRYCSGQTVCDKGKNVYYGWLNKLGLDDTKPYGAQAFQEAFGERFSWIAPHFTLIKQDTEAKYYRVEALFPLVSMNQNIYTEDELLRGTRTLRGKRVNINHTWVEPEDVSIERAEYEDACAEVLLRVGLKARFKGKWIVEMIDSEEICHVSIESDCLGGAPLQQFDGEVGYGCVGLEFTGLALLTKDVLPGVPLTRILPVERLVTEAIQLNEGERNMTEKQKPDPAKAAKPTTATSCDHEEAIANLKLELAELKREKRDVEETVKALEGKIRAKDRELAAKATRIAGFEDQEETVSKLRLEVSELKRASREKEEQLKTLKGTIAAKEEELGAKDERIASVEHELSQGAKKVDDAEARLNELRDLHKDTVEKNSDLTADKVKLEKRLELLETEKEELDAAAETLRAKLEENSNKRFDLAQRNIQLTQTLTARNDEIVGLKEENDQLREQLQKAKRMGRKIGKVKVTV